jgi:hypothetical protein
MGKKIMTLNSLEATKIETSDKALLQHGGNLAASDKSTPRGMIYSRHKTEESAFAGSIMADKAYLFTMID